tara:strand:+ start:1628 stop:2950 length:1323 start_codon:yes stop_codon:yes gene_type:complete
MNIYILGEECPRSASIEQIVKFCCGKRNLNFKVSNLQVTPVKQNNKFMRYYRISGVNVEGVKNVYYKIVRGTGSFVDYLCYFQRRPPIQADKPFAVIEDNKSRPSDAGNMHKQRLVKFVNVKKHYPGAHMLYLNIVPDFRRKEGIQPTYKRSVRMLNTLGVEVKLISFSGEDRTPEFNPYQSLEEFCEDYEIKGRAGETPTGIELNSNILKISTKLLKGVGGLSDPGVGFVCAAAQVSRNLGHDGEIIVINHGLSDNWLAKERASKLAQCSRDLGIKFKNTEGHTKINCSYDKEEYWDAGCSGEKHASILADIMLRSRPDHKIIYDNHAGTERGWFIESDGKHVSVAKNIGGIPDLVVKDDNTKNILVFEGEMYKNIKKGVKQIKTFKGFKRLLESKYPGYGIIFHLILNGGEKIVANTYFHLTDTGKMIFNERCEGYAV